MLLQFISIVLGYVIVVSDVFMGSKDQTLQTDLKILHDMGILFQVDNFAFHVASID